MHPKRKKAGRQAIQETPDLYGKQGPLLKTSKPPLIHSLKTTCALFPEIIH